MASDLWVLGMSLSHNGAVCLLNSSEIVVAIQEERLSRVKRAFTYGAKPSLALSYCLEYAGIDPTDLSLIVVSTPWPLDTPEQDITQNSILAPIINKVPVMGIPHHLGHAVSTFATSGFDEAAILIVDGLGSPYGDLFEWEKRVCKTKKLVGDLEACSETISMYYATSESIVCLEKHLGAWAKERKEGMPEIHSLGSMYAAVAWQIFGDSFEAGKVMGLAPYGVPDISTSEFYTLSEGEFVFHDKLSKRYLHNNTRWPLMHFEYKNLAASVQRALEDGISYLVGNLYNQTPVGNLCYAGGVALNSVMNERIIRESNFERVYIIPAAEDSGVAVGAAYYGLWQLVGKNISKKLYHDAVGRKYLSADILAAQEHLPPIFSQVRYQDLIAEVVDLLCQGKIIGWFQGRSELGPRALGQRSILCDPRVPNGKHILNERVKHREEFRPFAPMILLDEVNNWFDMGDSQMESPFMLRVCPFRRDKMDKVPAVVHVDGTGRVQTVTREANELLYELIRRFYERTEVPIILNTSFNVMGEPIVETPEDALLCFLTTGIDYCVIEDQLFTKCSSIMFDESHVWVYDRLREQITKSLSFTLSNNNMIGIGESSIHDLGDDYVGSYENPRLGVIRVIRDGIGLKLCHKTRGSFDIGYLKDNVFKIEGGPYQGFSIVFLRNKTNAVDCVTIASTRNPNRQYYFSRISGDSPDEAKISAGLTGIYKNDCRVLEISLSNGKLFVRIPSQRMYELVFCGGLAFCLKGVPGYGIEFVVDECGKITSVIAAHPEFTTQLYLNDVISPCENSSIQPAC
jgi:carbamoyltransferase